MKLEQLRTFFGKPVTLQFLEHWHALRYGGSAPGDDQIHFCIPAMEHVGPEGSTGADASLVQPMTTRMLGPVILGEAVLGKDGVHTGAVLMIRTPGPDGSELQISCDPENIAFVGLCIRPPSAEPTQQASRIVTL